MKRFIQLSVLLCFVVLTSCAGSKATTKGTQRVQTDEEFLAEALALVFPNGVKISFAASELDTAFFWQERAPFLRGLAVPESCIREMREYIDSCFTENLCEYQKTGKIEQVWNTENPVFKLPEYKGIKFTPSASYIISKPAFCKTREYVLLSIIRTSHSSISVGESVLSDGAVVSHYEAYTTACDMVFQMKNKEWVYVGKY